MGTPKKSTRTLSSAHFTVHYALSGPDAVRKRARGIADSLDIPGLGRRAVDAPDYVKQVLYWAERAFSAYVGAPFGFETPAADRKIQIHILRLPDLGKASRKGIILLHKDMTPDVLAITVAHELFHVVQYRFPRNGGRWRVAVIEGGAVYAEQFVTGAFYDTAADARSKSRSFRRIVEEPHRPLTVASYDCGLFWDYIGRQADFRRGIGDGEPAGPRLYRSVLARCASQGFTAVSIRRALNGKVPGFDLYRFRYDGAVPEPTLLSAETLIGNFAMAGCLEDNGFRSCDHRFSLSFDPTGTESPADGSSATAAVSGLNPAAPRATGFQSLGPGGGVTFHGTVGDFGSRFHGLDLLPLLDTVRVSLTTQTANRGLLLQIALVDDGGRVVDIVRTDRSCFCRFIGLERPGGRIERILLVATGIVDATDYELAIDPVSPRPDVMLTRWNAPPGRELERAPTGDAPTWLSPDIRALCDTGPDSTVKAGTVIRVETTLRNRGRADATDGELRLFYQWAKGLPQASRWRPLRDSSDGPARARVRRLRAGSDRVLKLNVRWPEVGVGDRLFIRASVACGNDDNTGNKAAVTRWPVGDETAGAGVSRTRAKSLKNQSLRKGAKSSCPRLL